MTSFPTTLLPAWEPDLRARVAVAACFAWILIKYCMGCVFSASGEQQVGVDPMSEDGMGMRKKAADGPELQLATGGFLLRWVDMRLRAVSPQPGASKTLHGTFLSVGAPRDLGNRPSKIVMTLSILLMFMRFCFHIRYIWLITFLHCWGERSISGRQLDNVYKEPKIAFRLLTKKFQALGIYTGEIIGEIHKHFCTRMFIVMLLK